MTITVTQQDIEKAKQLKEERRVPLCRSCPIALAVQRCFKDAIISVAYHAIYDDSKERKICDTTAEANDFIERFDADLEVEPFSFEVTV